jgi:hypothetical protein
MEALYLHDAFDPMVFLNMPEGKEKQRDKHRHCSIATTKHSVSTMAKMKQQKITMEQDNNQPLQYQQQVLT